MGRATNALLIYGYDLGGPDEWRIEGLGEWGALPPLAWLNDDEDDEPDFKGAADEHLLRTVGGFSEVWTPDADDGYRDRRRAAVHRVSVEIEMYCSDEAPMYALAAHTTTVARGDLDYIDPADLLHRPVLMNWDKRLADALDGLGLTPVQKAPRWFLVSYGDGF